MKEEERKKGEKKEFFFSDKGRQTDRQKPAFCLPKQAHSSPLLPATKLLVHPANCYLQREVEYSATPFPDSLKYEIILNIGLKQGISKLSLAFGCYSLMFVCISSLVEPSEVPRWWGELPQNAQWSKGLATEAPFLVKRERGPLVLIWELCLQTSSPWDWYGQPLIP